MEKILLDTVALGKKVRQYRKEKGYSANQLSEIAGVSKSHISNIESANSSASIDVLVQIANALEVSVDILLCDSLNEKVEQKARKNEFNKLLEDCTGEQTKVIVDTVRALRDSLREME